MAGFVFKTKSGSEYRIDYREDDQRFAVLNGGKFKDVDIVKPEMVSKGWPLIVKCLDTERNHKNGLTGDNVIRTSTIEHVYPFNTPSKSTEENEIEGYER